MTYQDQKDRNNTIGLVSFIISIVLSIIIGVGAGVKTKKFNVASVTFMLLIMCVALPCYLCILIDKPFVTEDKPTK